MSNVKYRTNRFKEKLHDVKQFTVADRKDSLEENKGIKQKTGNKIFVKINKVGQRIHNIKKCLWKIGAYKYYTNRNTNNDKARVYEL